MKLNEVFLRILAFMLGIKHESPEELARSGRKLKGESIINSVANRIHRENIESIWRLGAIEYSDKKLAEIAEILRQGTQYEFSIPTTFNFEGDYIDFYQITTKDNRYFIYAMSDTYAISKGDGEMMFVEIKDRYSTDNFKVGSKLW
jgi:hypothetical protein